MKYQKNSSLGIKQQSLNMYIFFQISWIHTGELKLIVSSSISYKSDKKNIWFSAITV
jgi:hypothetical protein